jgi:hypothetical protein
MVQTVPDGENGTLVEKLFENGAPSFIILHSFTKWWTMPLYFVRYKAMVHSHLSHWHQM